MALWIDISCRKQFEEEVSPKRAEIDANKLILCLCYYYCCLLFMNELLLLPVYRLVGFRWRRPVPQSASFPRLTVQRHLFSRPVVVQ